jgi:hypothetical protein
MQTTVLQRSQNQTIPLTLATIAAAVVLPFLVHLVPASGGVPLGARLLPIFYAPLLAVIFFRPQVALIAALLAPVLNHLLIGMPTAEMTVILTLELAVFTGVVYALNRRWPAFWLAAPLALLLAKVASLLLVTLVPALIVPPPLVYFENSLVNGLPGLAILLVLNLTAVYVAKYIHER